MIQIKEYAEEILSEIKEDRIETREELEKRKKELAKEFGLDKLPSNPEILSFAEKRDEVKDLLQKKPTRSLSGVSVVAIMTEPADCPGDCIYCPQGDAPKSYTGYEPAALRAKHNEFDAKKQVEQRLRQIRESGHPANKIELIIMGGTFTALEKSYQDQFIQKAFNALNDDPSKDIEEAQKKNETSDHRCVGLTLELRPDYCGKDQLRRGINYGTTRVELGVQNPEDRIYRRVDRGHTVEDVVDATKRLKDSGLKVLYHLMPGMPFSSKEKDIEMFKKVFKDPRFKPDMLKIYPCLLLKEDFVGEEIHELYRSGEWEPLNTEEASEILSEARKYFPEWVRVMRVMRDVPFDYVEEGVEASNLRQLIEGECSCIRCREAGRTETEGEPELKEKSYKASGGKECFLSFTDEKNALYGFLRLRKPSSVVQPELDGAALVRELHVYGPEARVGDEGKIQHKGLGSLLLEEAENKALEWGLSKVSVTSGVGVRNYYRSKGYELKGPYMVKQIQ